MDDKHNYRLIDIAKSQYQTISFTPEEWAETKKKVQKDVMANVSHEHLGKYRDQISRSIIKKQVQQSIERIHPELEYEEKLRYVEKLTNEISGYGILEPYLNDSDITEILIEKYDKITIEKDGTLHQTDAKFDSEEDLRLVLERILLPLGKQIDWSEPTVDARLPDGSRIAAVIPPVAVDGTQVSIRKFKPNISLDKLIEFGALNEKLKQGLVQCIEGRLSILVSGGTGSGKSTFLNALSEYINPNLSIITIENPIELQFKHPHVRRWEARSANIEGKGEISIRHLVIVALRSRPDIIIIGEVRGSEAQELLNALNTGHDGSMSTIHANSPNEAINDRLVSMVSSAGQLAPSLVPSYVSTGIDLVVQLSRMPDGSRKLVSIHEVMGEKDGKIKTNPLIEWKTHSFDGKKIVGDWYSTNKFSRIQKLKDKGIDFIGW